jgi:hypothetical protein
MSDILKLDHPHSKNGTRIKDGESSPASYYPLQEGQPIMPGAEIVRAKRRKDDPSVMDLTPVYKTKGPGQVATPAYRKNYGSIFGSKKPRGVN